MLFESGGLHYWIWLFEDRFSIRADPAKERQPLPAIEIEVKCDSVKDSETINGWKLLYFCVDGQIRLVITRSEPGRFSISPNWNFIPPKRAIGAINIICTDITRSLHFYRDLLGFTLVEQQDWFAHLKCGERDLTLLAVAKEANERQRYCQRPSVSFDLSVADLPGTLARLQSGGVMLTPGHDVTAKRAFIEDPDGLVIELLALGA